MAVISIGFCVSVCVCYRGFCMFFNRFSTRLPRWSIVLLLALLLTPIMIARHIGGLLKCFREFYIMSLIECPSFWLGLRFSCLPFALKIDSKPRRLWHGKRNPDHKQAHRIDSAYKRPIVIINGEKTTKQTNVNNTGKRQTEKAMRITSTDGLTQPAVVLQTWNENYAIPIIR